MMTSNYESTNFLPNLLSVAQVTRLRSQFYLQFRLYSNYLSVILSCASILFPITSGWIVILLAGIFQVTSIIFKNISKNYHDLSREAQRRALIENSFEKSIEDFDISELYSKVGERLLLRAKTYDFNGDYYSSTNEAGYSRFRDNLQESCFFSRSLIEMEKNRLWIKVISMFSLLGFVTFLLLLGVFNPEGLDFRTFRYIVGGMSIVLFFILNDDFETYNNCLSSYKIFKDVDTRLSNLENIEELFSSFADYSVAALLSPPIPTSLYNKKREHLNHLWFDIRNKKKNKVISFEQSSYTETKIENTNYLSANQHDVVTLDWVIKELKLRLSSNPNNVSHTKKRLDGWSGSPVYEVVLKEKSTDIFQLVVKFHKSKVHIAKELDIIKRLNTIGTDLLCYTLLEEAFVDKGILVYYHATHRTQEEMISLNKYILSSIKRKQNLKEFYERLRNFVLSVTSAFDKLDNNVYKIKSFGDYILQIKSNLPPNYIIDLTGLSRFKIVNNDLIVSNNQSYPDLEMIDQLYSITAEELKSSNVNISAEDWIKINVENLQVNKMSENVFIYAEIKDSRDLICIIVPISLYEDRIEKYIVKELQVIIISPSSSKLIKFDKYYEQQNKSDSKSLLERELIDELIEKLADKEIKLALRHSDFHTNNILCSKNSFKIIDIGDLEICPVLFDVARLEISILFEVLDELSVSTDELLLIYQKIYDQKNDKLSNNATILYSILYNIRKGIKNNSIKINSYEDYLTYYLEIITQIGYSITGSRKTPLQMIAILEYYTNKLRTIYDQKSK